MATILEVLATAVEYHQAGSLEQAERLYRQVLAVQPWQFDALHLLGLVCHQSGRCETAVDLVTRALVANPDAAEAHYNLGKILQEQGRLHEAVASYQQAVRLQPDYAEAHYNLGNALRDAGLLDQAMASFRQAIRARPGYAKPYTNLANVLLGEGRVEEAVNLFEAVVRLQPQSAAAHCNLAGALRQLGKLEEAVAHGRNALQREPQNHEAHTTLGAALWEQGKLEEAMASFAEAIRLKPDHARAHVNRAIGWLLQGDLEQGWPEYEWRCKTDGASPPAFTQPAWDGSSLDGRTILLAAEQGLGDVLHFIRYAAVLKGRFACRVVVACQKALLPLLNNCPGIDQLVALGASMPACDVYAPLLSLPRLLGTTLATIPADVPYLFPDPELVARWRAELSTTSGLRIGIVWQGNPRYPSDRFRSVPLGCFAPMARLEGVRLFSLQKGPGIEQLRAAGDRFPIIDLGQRLDETAGAFMDTAAVMQNLDLVVAPDMAIAHLAGGLGVPVWVALSFVPDWRWLQDRSHSPWYPTARLFRQKSPGDWPSVFQEIAAALDRRLGTA